MSSTLNDQWKVPLDSRICIIGAGIAGLITANRLIRSGFKNIKILERESNLGGVWSESRSYPGLHIQTPIGRYSFPEFPFPSDLLKSDEEDPYNAMIDGKRKLEYIQRYAKSNDIYRLISFQTEVISARLSKDKCHWILVTSNHTKIEFDFLIPCTGLFDSSRPNLKGISMIQDPSMPSKTVVSFGWQVKDLSVFTNKRVIVIGGGKSGKDAAFSISAHQKKSSKSTNTRSSVWINDPDYRPFFPIDCSTDHDSWPTWPSFRSPFATPALSKYPDIPGACGWTFKDEESRQIYEAAHFLNKQIVWNFLDSVWRSKVPKEWLNTDFSWKKMAGIQIHSEPYNESGETYLQMFREGHLKVIGDGWRCAEIDQLNGMVKFRSKNDPKGLIFDEIDHVVVCTGFEIGWPFFKDAWIQKELFDNESGEINLFRRMVSAKIPRLAFVGNAVWTVAHVPMYVQAKWLSNLMRGEMKLEMTSKYMENAIKSELEWLKKVGEPTFTVSGKGHFYSLELIADMGLLDQVPSWIHCQSFNDWTYQWSAAEWHVFPFQIKSRL